MPSNLPNKLKSNKSKKLEKFLEEMTPEKVELILDLERASRILVHVMELQSDINMRDVHALRRAQLNLQDKYDLLSV